jgi:hypothetical protein
MRLQILGLTGLVLVILATGLSGSAPAANLCEGAGTPCPDGKTYTNKTIKAVLVWPFAELHTDIGNIECTKGALEAPTETSKLGEFASGILTVLEFETCTDFRPPLPPEACTLTAINLPYGLGLTATGGGNGKLEIVTGTPGFLAQCGAAINCTFEYPGTSLTVTSGGVPPAPAPKLTASIAKMTWEGEACPKKLATWAAEYEVTEPRPLGVTSEATPSALCSENAKPCPAAKTYGSGTATEGKATANFKFAFKYNEANKEAECTSLVSKGKTTGTSGAVIGEITALTFGTGGKCGGCTVTAQNLPYKLEIERSGGGNGTMVWRTSGKGDPQVLIKCGGLLEECTYGAAELPFTITGAAVATYVLPKTTLSKQSGTLCSSTATWEGVGGTSESKYEFASPAPLFVTYP